MKQAWVVIGAGSLWVLSILLGVLAPGGVPLRAYTFHLMVLASGMLGGSAIGVLMIQVHAAGFIAAALLLIQAASALFREHRTGETNWLIMPLMFFGAFLGLVLVSCCRQQPPAETDPE